MKKILYSLIAVLAMVMSSCSNDDIEVIKTGGVNFNVSTQSVYDDFEVAELFKNNFLSGSYNIGVYTFVYDEEGNLAASDSLYTKTFGSVEQRFGNLLCGEYTAITVEMLVDADDNYQSDAWRIIGKEKLSTLEIVHKDYIDSSKEDDEKSYDAYWYMAVGYIATKLNVENKSEQILNVIPKGIGVVIDTYMTNFDQSNFKALFFSTKNQPVGRYLSPNYTDEDRFHYDRYTAKDTYVVRGGARMTSMPKIYNPSIYLLEEGEVQCCFAAHKENADGTLNLRFTPYPNDYTRLSVRDGKTYIGGFNYLGGANEKCDAKFFDNIDDYLTWYNAMPVEKSLVPNLYLTWGGSVSNVQSFMNGYTMTLGKNGQAVSMSDGSYEVDYKGNGKESSISYSFKSQTTGLFEVDVKYAKATVTKEEIQEYLVLNYTYVTSRDEIYMYMSSDGKTVVMFFSLGDEWNLGFVDINELDSGSDVSVRYNPNDFLKTYIKKMK